MDTGIAVARAVLVAPFVFAGAVKFDIDISGKAAHIAEQNLPVPTILAVASGAVEVIYGLMVAVGWSTRFAALALAAYVIVVTFFFHDFWTMPAGREQIGQMLHALKNLSIVLLFVAFAGPGRFSLDARRAYGRRTGMLPPSRSAMRGAYARRHFMSLMARNFLSVAVAVFVWVPAALAQSSSTGCTLDRVAWTFRQILRCQDGLTIVAETGAQFTLADRDGDGNADLATLRLKALLIEGPAGKAESPAFR